MLNKDAKLNEKVFEKEVEMKATRDGYGDGLMILGEADPNVVVLSADLTESTRAQKFAEKYPERFVQIGVAEQNLAAVAAGLGVSGKTAFISSYATFSPGRNWEQVRTTICYNDSNVKIAGHHAGLMTGPDGATHEATEDIAIMRALPNMRVFVPCDAIQAKQATLAAGKLWGPTYIRFSREKSPTLTTEATPFTAGKAEVFWQSKKPEVAIIVTGILTHNAMVAAKELDEEGVGSVVLNVHTIKPLDEKKIAEVVKKCGAVVSVEEHQIHGGLGDAVAGSLTRSYPAPQEFIGMQNTFGESGNPWDLVNKYGMGVKDIKAAAKKAIRRK